MKTKKDKCHWHVTVRNTRDKSPIFPYHFMFIIFSPFPRKINLESATAVFDRHTLAVAAPKVTSAKIPWRRRQLSLFKLIGQKLFVRWRGEGKEWCIVDLFKTISFTAECILWTLHKAYLHATFPKSRNLDIEATLATTEEKNLNCLIYIVRFHIICRIGQNFTQGRNLV